MWLFRLSHRESHKTHKRIEILSLSLFVSYSHKSWLLSHWKSVRTPYINLKLENLKKRSLFVIINKFRIRTLIINRISNKKSSENDCITLLTSWESKSKYQKILIKKWRFSSTMRTKSKNLNFFLHKLIIKYNWCIYTFKLLAINT